MMPPTSGLWPPLHGMKQRVTKRVAYNLVVPILGPILEIRYSDGAPVTHENGSRCWDSRKTEPGTAAALREVTV